jgi:hypothetical protein
MNDLATEPTFMSDNLHILENAAAELTSAVYPMVLRRGPKDSWINVELALWRALAEAIKRWARQKPSAAASDDLEAWREGLLADLTDSAFHVALKNGIAGSLLELELALYRAVRLVIRRRGRVSKSA